MVAVAKALYTVAELAKYFKMVALVARALYKEVNVSKAL